MDYDLPEKAAEDKRERSREDRFMNTTDESCILINGHHQVDLPLRHAELNLPSNTRMAEDGFKSLYRKLALIPQLKADYVAFIQDMIDKGHAEGVLKQMQMMVRNGTYCIMEFAIQGNLNRPGSCLIVLQNRLEHQ